jgi:hypothetical protein
VTLLLFVHDRWLHQRQLNHLAQHHQKYHQRCYSQKNDMREVRTILPTTSTVAAFGDLHLFAVQNLTASDLWVEGDVAAGFGLSMARFDVGAGGGGPAVQSSYGLSLVDGSVHGDVVSAAFNNLLRVSLVDGGELLPATSAAPPIRPPSMSGWLKSSAAFCGLTLPP